MTPIIKKTGIAVVALVVLFYGYNYFFSSDKGPLFIATPVEGSPETQEFLIRLNKLESIQADMDLFNDPRFVSLEDRRQVIPEETTGRSNPFESVR